MGKKIKALGKGEGKVKKERGGKEGREKKKKRGKGKKEGEKEKKEGKRKLFFRNLEWRARCTFVCTCIYHIEILVKILFESGA